MKLQKIILCVAVALTAFGTSLGLFELGGYLRAAFQPLKVERQPLEPFTPPVYAPAQIPEFKPPAFTPTAEPEPAEEPEDWGETGNYYIIGDNPKGFADFEWLNVVTHEFNEKRGKVLAVKPSGSIDTENKEFNFTWINITGKRISLVTQTKKGISYQFDGKFVDEEVNRRDSNGEEFPVQVDLKGRLTKWRNGVKIAEAEVKLAISGC